MRVPETKTEDGKHECEAFLDDIIRNCEATSIDRFTINDNMRNYCLFGAAAGQDVNYNKIYPTISLLRSFLYGQESVNFSIKFGQGVPKEQYRYMETLRLKAHELWHDTATDELFGEAVFWALTYNSFFIKVIWNGGLRTYPLEPHLVGVYREDVPILDNQEAITHLYYTTQSALRSMLREHPNRDKIMDRVSISGPVDESQVPQTVSQLVLSQTDPRLIGNVAQLSSQNMYRPQISPNLIEMREVWVYDDDLEDYRVFTIANPNVMIYDRPGAKLCTKGEHPFIKITPLRLYNYIWGQSMVQNLVGLQDWRDQQMGRINTVFNRKLRPSRMFTGPWTGLTDEKMAALDRPGGFFSSTQPTAKVETYAPDVDITQAMGYVHEIDNMFNEMAGLANILRAEGDEGVRSMQHAQVLARMGSSRVKQIALALENPAEKLATLMMKIQRDNDKNVYLDDEEKEFLLSQVNPDFNVKVSGHSLSPVFVEDMKQLVQQMLANKVIDRKSFLDLLQPPMTEMLEERLKKIEEGEAKEAKAKMGLEVVKVASKLK